MASHTWRSPDMVLRALQLRLPGSKFSPTPSPVLHHQGRRITFHGSKGSFRVYFGHRDSADSRFDDFQNEEGVILHLEEVTQAPPAASGVACTYCGAMSHLESASFVYGSPRPGKVHVCANFPACDAYVGADAQTGAPLGTLANAALRRARQDAHSAFDRIWADKPKYTRLVAYRTAAAVLGLTEFHIGSADIDTCRQLVDMIGIIEELVEADRSHPRYALNLAPAQQQIAL